VNFAEQFQAFLIAARDKLAAEGHAAADVAEERLAELRPLLAQDAARAEADALELVKTLLGRP
jgi:N-acetylglutamate synthase-like GNAT family acetyltransferase